MLSSARAQAILAEPDCEPARAHFTAIAGLAAPRPGTSCRAPPRACDRAETSAAREIMGRSPTSSASAGRGLANRIVAAMGDFRTPVPGRDQPSLTTPSNRRTATGSCTSGSPTTTCPGSSAPFKTYLNQNTIRDIASFQSQLNRQADLIKDGSTPSTPPWSAWTTTRAGTSGSSRSRTSQHGDQGLPGRPAGLHRQRRVGLIADDDQYSEQKFLQVKRIIERFKGREGQTEADRKWTRAGH